MSGVFVFGEVVLPCIKVFAMQTPYPLMRELLNRTPVMPILTLHDADTAPDLARALLAGGISVFEVVLRTPAAVEAVKNIRQAVPQAVVGMGTLMTPQDIDTAMAAGAMFGVSPGLTEELAQAVQSRQWPFLPGVATASEVMAARRWGFRELKYFPAQGSAGVKWLSDMRGVFPDVLFCPTGGIRPPDIAAYLALANCNTVGGSWVVPAERLAAKDWSAITQLAQQASGMRASG